MLGYSLTEGEEMPIPEWFVIMFCGRKALETLCSEGVWKSGWFFGVRIVLRTEEMDEDEDWELDLVTANRIH